VIVDPAPHHKTFAPAANVVTDMDDDFGGRGLGVGASDFRKLREGGIEYKCSGHRLAM
jgi:hypothetical protein